MDNMYFQSGKPLHPAGNRKTPVPELWHSISERQWDEVVRQDVYIYDNHGKNKMI